MNFDFECKLAVDSASRKLYKTEHVYRIPKYRKRKVFFFSLLLSDDKFALEIWYSRQSSANMPAEEVLVQFETGLGRREPYTRQRHTFEWNIYMCVSGEFPK